MARLKRDLEFEISDGVIKLWIYRSEEQEFLDVAKYLNIKVSELPSTKRLRFLAEIIIFTDKEVR